MISEITPEILVAVIVGLGIPVVSAAVYAIRYFVNKGKCFALLKQRVEQQEKETESGKESHKELYQKMDEMNVKLASLETAVDIIVKKLN